MAVSSKQPLNFSCASSYLLCSHVNMTTKEIMAETSAPSFTEWNFMLRIFLTLLKFIFLHNKAFCIHYVDALHSLFT